MVTINTLGTTKTTQAASTAIKSSSFNPQLAFMLLNAANMEQATEQQKKTMEKAMDNLKKQNYANQLNEQISQMKAARATKDGSATSGKQVDINDKAAGTQLIANMKAAGLTVTDSVANNIKNGTFSQDDLDSLSASVKTMQDEATNQSQMDNMTLQNLNNRQNQFVSAFMSAVDALKSMFDRIFR